MTTTTQTKANPEFQTQPEFVDRRGKSQGNSHGAERRQFGNSHVGLSHAARELAEAIDGYKLQHRRRYITFEEMLAIIQQLGYQKLSTPRDADGLI